MENYCTEKYCIDIGTYVEYMHQYLLDGDSSLGLVVSQVG